MFNDDYKMYQGSIINGQAYLGNNKKLLEKLGLIDEKEAVPEKYKSLSIQEIISSCPNAEKDILPYISWWQESDGSHSITLNTKLKDSAIQLIRKGPDVTINVNAKFIDENGNVIKDDDELVKSVKQGMLEWGQTYQSQQKNGFYYDDFGMEGYVDVKVQINGDNKPSNSMNIHIIDNAKQHAQEPWTEKITHFSHLDPEKHSHEAGGWRLNNNKEIWLYTLDERGFGLGGARYGEKLSNVAKHEFGHSLGLGDAYTDKKYNRVAPKNSEEIPNNIFKGTNVMNYNDIITPNDIEMVLKAWQSGVEQHYSNYSFIYKGHEIEREKSDVIRLD